MKGALGRRAYGFRSTREMVHAFDAMVTLFAPSAGYDDRRRLVLTCERGRPWREGRQYQAAADEDGAASDQ